jgi:hypothetical protein
VTDQSPEPAPENIPSDDAAKEAARAEEVNASDVAAFVQTRENVRGAIEPRDRLAAKIDMPPSVPTESMLPPTNRTILADQNIYQAVRYVVSTPLGANATPEDFLKTFQVSGDHLYVAEVNTMLPVYVKMGRSSNPWIRVQRGMTLRRRFDVITVTIAIDVRVFSQGTPFVGNDDALFYVSTGPLVEDEGSFSDDAVTPVCYAGLVTPGGLGFAQRLFDPIAALPPKLTIGKGGGFIQVFNVDTANTLYVWSPLSPQGSAANPGGFTLLAGQSLTVPLKGRIYDAGVNDPVHIGWSVGTVGGTCQFVIAVSGLETDVFDATGSRSGGING